MSGGAPGANGSGLTVRGPGVGVSGLRSDRQPARTDLEAGADRALLTYRLTDRMNAKCVEPRSGLRSSILFLLLVQ